MGKLSATTSVTTTTTTEVKLTPKQKVTLRKALKMYAELHQQEKAAKLAKKKQVDIVRAVREEIGVDALAFEGFKTKNVPNLRNKLDKKLFVELGGSLEMLNNATRAVPGTPYEKITPPGEKDEDDNE